MSAYSQQSNNQTKTWLLMFIFVGLVSGIFYGFSSITGNFGLAYIGLIISLVQCAVAYFLGDKIALASAGAIRLKDGEMPMIQEMVLNLTKIAGIPVPKIFISPDPSPNAFACGKDTKSASICLNQGILDLLDRNELEGVIAHELSHIKNRDILIMTVSMVLASVISFVADISLRMNFFDRGSREENKNNNFVIIFFYIFLMILAPIISTLIQMAVSRQREFLADATAITITRYPNGLKNALIKLYKNPIPSQHYSTATNHFFISPPKKSWDEKISQLWSTHPSLKDRIDALNSM